MNTVVLGNRLAPSARAQTAALTRRAITGYLREPGSTVFPFLFPLFYAALSVSSYGRSTSLPGFPKVDSYLDFALAATVTQGVLFGCTEAGNRMAIDIQSGFMDRVLASPATRIGILVARLAGAFAYGVAQSLAFLVILTLFGARVHAGVAGWLVILLYGGMVAVGVGGLMVALAIRSGSTEVLQGMFPLVFLVLFLSSAFFPVRFMTGWWHSAARHSPITWMIDGIRHLTIVGWDWAAAGKALGTAAVLVVIAAVLCLRSFTARAAAS